MGGTAALKDSVGRDFMSNANLDFLPLLFRHRWHCWSAFVTELYEFPFHGLGVGDLLADNPSRAGSAIHISLFGKVLI